MNQAVAREGRRRGGAAIVHIEGGGTIGVNCDARGYYVARTDDAAFHRGHTTIEEALAAAGFMRSESDPSMVKRL